MRYVIVDDNPTDQLMIQALARQYPFLKMAGCFLNPLEAVAFIRDNPPDLLFLDVEMPVMNGTDFLRSLTNPPSCIFITSHPNYAVEAFELFAIDYILKPIKKERFHRAIVRMQDYASIHEKVMQYEHHVKSETIVIQEGYDTHKILLSDIIYLEALRDYTRIFTANRTYITLGSLGNIVESLNVSNIRRVHRSYAVHAGKIESILENSLMIGKVEIPIGRTFRKDFTSFKKKNF